MRKFFTFVICFLALATYAHGQTTYTPNLNLALPLAEPNTWGSQYNNNFSILDNAVGSGGTTDTTCSTGSVFTAIAGGVPTCTPISVLAQSLSLTGDITPPQIVANTNDYSPTGLSTASVLRLSTDASRNLTGIAGGSDGRTLILYNVGSFNIVLKNLTTSAANNQFSINADITIAPNQGIIVQYDSTASKWRAASGISGGGAGQAADNDLTAISALSTTGIATRTATDTWTTRTLQGTANRVTVTNGDGVSGNPIFNLGSLAVQTDQSNTWTLGDQDCSACTSFKIPIATGASPTISGRIAYDSTANRYKFGVNGSTITIPTLAEIQPLNSNLTALAALTGSNNGFPFFTGAGAMSQSILPSCPDSGGNHLNFDTTTHIWTCGTSSSGGISGLSTGKIPKAASATSLADSILSDSGSAITVGGGLVVGSSPFLIFDTSGIASTDKTWTVMNFSGTIRPSTGAFTAGHVITVDANGLLVDGGVAGSGTWTDSSTSTGTNKTLRDALAGGTGNAIWTPVRASWDAGSLTPDGTNCADPTRQTINSGPTLYAFSCADSNSSTFDGHLTLPITMAGNLATVKFRLTVNDVDSASQVFGGGFKAMCRASGTTVDGTWGTAQTVAITMTTANNDYSATTAAVTPNGTCSAGSELFWRFTVDGTGTNTDDGDARVISVMMEQQS